MSDLPNNVRFTWQLVSQFVSWEFCRYMSENNDSNSETDVLSFLRNMVVQRTEKSVSEVTKHEIIAKFIMEIKAISNCQISCIIPLSESVKRICPELNSTVNKLVHHLETFFAVLESTDESRKELIRLRIEDAISDFSREASRLLPEPELLQVVDSWNGPHHHHFPPAKPLKKSVYNAMLFEEVLKCLHFEGMTPSEARLIAVSLNEDKVFEKILRNAEAEPETEADSEQFTLSQSSQPVYSQEFVKNTQVSKPCANVLHQKQPTNYHHLQAHTQVHSPLNNSPVQIPDDSPVLQSSPDLVQNEDSLHVIAGTPPSPPPSPPDYPFLHRTMVGNKQLQNGNKQLQNHSSSSHMQFAQSSANESDDDVQDRIHAKFQEMYESRKRQNPSDSDTSDCEKNPEFRFLTPTYFKKGQTEAIYVSDVESNDSSILSIAPSSQKSDPNWSRRQSFLPATQYVRPNKRKLKPVSKKKAVGQIYSSDSDENPISPASRAPLRSAHPASRAPTRSPHPASRAPTRSPHPASRAPTRSPHPASRASTRSPNPVLKAPLRSPHHPSTSATRTRAELIGPFKKRKMIKALYRSPTLCIDDFVSVVRKPNSETTLSEVSVPNVTASKKAKKTPAPSGSNTFKKQKCKECNRSYKTAVALRRHVFLKHTEPPEDSDCDT